MSSKYFLLAAQLRQLCWQMRKHGETRLPGELEISRNTGYSRQTVRHALSLLEEEGTIVRLHGSGTYLSESRHPKNTQVAVLVSEPDHYLYPQLLRDIEAVLSPAGYQAKAFATKNLAITERKLLSDLLAHPPAGIIAEPAKSALPSPNLDLLAQISQKRIPLVWLHASLPIPESAPCFRDDNAGGAAQLVRYLYEKGHRQIAGIFKNDDRQGLERYLGFISELLRKDLPISEENICWFNTAEKMDLLIGESDWLDRFAESRLGFCTAVVCYNDEIAYFLVRRLLKAGRHIPEDTAVVSFDNSHLCSLSPVPLTSLAHERHQLGSSAAEALLKLLRQKPVSPACFPWSLQERGSS